MATGGLFNRVKIWVFEEVLKSKDLNAEFDNIINHMSAGFIGGFSQTIAQMQTQLNPGGLGTEVLAQNLAQEIEQLRFVIARITGLPFWYQAPALSIEAINTLLQVGVGIPKNRIESGRTRSGNNQPLFLQADGTNPTVTLLATTVNFKVVIQNVEYTFTADTQVTGMSLAPSTGNTATVNNGLAALDPLSIFAGESDFTLPTFTIAACGSEIVSLVGQYAAFKVVDGANTEYFIGFIDSAALAGAGLITKVFRGYFFDNTDAPVQATALTDGDTVTLMKMFYIFAKSDLTITSTTSPPTYAAVAPTSPSLGEYWFDLTNQIWMIYNGASFVNSNSTLIGIAIVDTAACVATRSFEFFSPYKDFNSLIMEFIDGSTLKSSQLQQGVSVKGIPFEWDQNFLQFIMPSHLTDTDGSTTETATTQYFLYISDLGQQVFSTIRPYDRIYDLLGSYHRYKPWRCIASIMTEATPLLDEITLLNKNQLDAKFIRDGSISLTKLSSKSTGTSVGVGGVAISSSCGVFTTASGAFVDVTNLNVTLVTTGRPVYIGLISDGTATDTELSGGSRITIVRDSTDLNLELALGSGGTNTAVPVGCVWHIDVGAVAGTHTYKLQVRKAGAFNPIVNRCFLLAYEI